jgi:flagellar hook-associated protein 3 FlgL
MMRVSSKMIYNSLTYNIMNLEDSINRTTDQASSGRRIIKPSEDPIGTTRAMRYRTQNTEIQKYTDNANAASSLLSAADTACFAVVDSLQRVRELVVEGANSTNNQLDWDSMASEVDQIKAGLVDLANSSMGDRYIFAGEKYPFSAYTLRANVSGDHRDITAQPIVIDAHNNQFKIKLDDTATKTITLTHNTYDGTLGHTLEDLVNDVQKQLNNVGFSTPVYAKVNTNNQISFYAGVRPDDGIIHSLVVKSGPSIKDIGKAVSATTNKIELAASANTAVPDYYQGWTIRITAGKGVGEINTVKAYDPATKLADVAIPWLNAPDSTSSYELIPPLEGQTNVIPGAAISLAATGANAPLDGFYTGMTINITDELGKTESHKITGYSNATGEISIAPGNFTLTGPVTYKIIPVTAGPAISNDPTGSSIRLTDDSSQFDDFYAGSSITVTYKDGGTETRKITGYDAATKLATVDQPWSKPFDGWTRYSITDTTLDQMGFVSQDTTKQIIGNPLDQSLKVLGRYPVRNDVYAEVSGTDTNVTLNPIDANPTPNFFQNWTITITDGPGAGQSRLITASGDNGVTVDSPWDLPLATNSKYAIRPPLLGTVAESASNGPPPSLKFAANSSTVPDFYKGMTVSIFNGKGVGQTRTIESYDPVTQVAIVDRDWENPLPDSSSSYVIDDASDVSGDSKFIITVGIDKPQEITLDGGNYTPVQLARNIQEKINERGGHYANVRVMLTDDKRLKMVYHDPDLNDNDAPLPIKLNSGSKADFLPKMGFADGTASEKSEPNFEGNRSHINYEVNFGVKIKVNIAGDLLFDPIFQHLSEISIHLRSGNNKALSEIDITKITDDIDNILITQGEIGAKINRLTNSIERFNGLADNITKLQSDIEDVDISKIISELEMRRMTYQAALQVGGQILPVNLLSFLK